MRERILGPGVTENGFEALLNGLLSMKANHHGGIRFIGASISVENTLELAIEENLLAPFDVIQMPVGIFVERQDLIRQIPTDKAIVVNSPVRR